MTEALGLQMQDLGSVSKGLPHLHPPSPPAPYGSDEVGIEPFLVQTREPGGEQILRVRCRGCSRVSMQKGFAHHVSVVPFLLVSVSRTPEVSSLSLLPATGGPHPVPGASDLHGIPGWPRATSPTRFLPQFREDGELTTLRRSTASDTWMSPSVSMSRITPAGAREQVVDSHHQGTDSRLRPRHVSVGKARARPPVTRNRCNGCYMPIPLGPRGGYPRTSARRRVPARHFFLRAHASCIQCGNLHPEDRPPACASSVSYCVPHISCWYILDAPPLHPDLPRLGEASSWC